MTWNHSRDHWLKAFDDEALGSSSTEAGSGFLDAFDGRVAGSLEQWSTGSSAGIADDATTVGTLGKQAPVTEDEPKPTSKADSDDDAGRDTMKLDAQRPDQDDASPQPAQSDEVVVRTDEHVGFDRPEGSDAGQQPRGPGRRAAPQFSSPFSASETIPPAAESVLGGSEPRVEEAPLHKKAASSKPHGAPAPAPPSLNLLGNLDRAVIPDIVSSPGHSSAVPSPVGGESEVDELSHEELELEEVDELEECGKKTSAPVMPPTPPPKAPSRKKKSWADDVFGEHYSALAPSGVGKSAQRDVDFILGSVLVKDAAAVLDVGCGAGHHSAAFADRGFKVTGIDNSMSQLLLATELTNEANGDAVMLHGDMRDLELDGEFDLVVCLGSTFGYYEDELNLRVLEQMRDRLAPGGRLVIQVFNRDFIVNKLPCRSWWQGNGCVVMDEAEFNYKANRLRVHRTIMFEDARQFEHYMFLRTYTVHDLGKMCAQADLKVTEFSGSRETRGRFYGSTSPDIWIVAERKS